MLSFVHPVTVLSARAQISRGSESAPVTIVEYVDFESPMSRRAQIHLMRLLSNYPGAKFASRRDIFPVRSMSGPKMRLEPRWRQRGKAYLERSSYSSFPCRAKSRSRYSQYFRIHPEAKRAAIAANCAARQSAFWPMHHELFVNQSRLGDALYNELARQLELDEAAFETCLSDPNVADEIDLDVADASKRASRGNTAFPDRKNRKRKDHTDSARERGSTHPGLR